MSKLPEGDQRENAGGAEVAASSAVTCARLDPAITMKHSA